MRMKQLLLLLFVGVTLCISSPVSGVTVFFDDFERGPLVGLEAITNLQPATGLWTVTGNQTVYGFKGDWHPASGGIPDSYVFGGQKFALTIRDAVNVGGGTYCNVNATFAEQASASDVVRFEADFWGQDGDAALKLAFLTGDTELNDVTLLGGASGSVSVGEVDTGLTYTLDEWHHVTMDYSPMTSIFSLAIDAQPAVTGLAITPSAVDGFRFVQTSELQDRWSVYDNVLVTVTADSAPNLPGDANLDGVVDNLDAIILAENWQTATGATWGMGDFNDDGAVDDMDATLLATNWQVGSTGASVPEPSTLVGLLGLCLAGLLALARRQQ